jgi:predicted nucleic acid-binding protein
MREFEQNRKSIQSKIKENGSYRQRECDIEMADGMQDGEGSFSETSVAKRRITIDSNVIIAAVFSKGGPDESTAQRAIIKCKTHDIPMLTDIVADECLKRARKPRSRVSISTMRTRLNDISSEIINLKPIPSIGELKKKYKIRDVRDLKILYSADITDSVIVITQDKDFFAGVDGIHAKVMDIYEYDKEDRTQEQMDNNEE